jgi:hypothetical protein
MVIGEEMMLHQYPVKQGTARIQYNNFTGLGHKKIFKKVIILQCGFMLQTIKVSQ